MKRQFYKIAACYILGLAIAANANAQTIETIAGTGSAGDADAPAATAATFSWPNQVAMDASGNMYITDRGNNKIRKISATGVVTTIAGTGMAGFSGDGGPAASGATQLSSPCGIAVDPAGNIYFADLNNARIRKINTSGTISTVAGGGTGTTDGIMATASAMGNPVGIALDNSGNLYIATYSDNKVRKVSTSGIITTVAGTGTAGFSGDGGAATAATLNAPHGVVVDATGNVYITDISNHRIRKVNTSGTISTIAGTGTMGFAGDGGPATAANLWSPYGIVLDADGNFFFTDFANNRVRRISASGTISTVAGAGSYSYSGDGGPATAATMKNPIGLAIDNANNIVVVDGDNHRIRRINAVAAVITGSSSVCVGSSTTYTSAVPGGAWSSSSPATATVSSSGSVAGVAAGTATIRYSATLINGTKVVTVNPALGAPSITASGATLSVPATFATYQWTLAGSPISGATSDTYTATAAGTYAVHVTNIDGCSASSANYVLSSVSVPSVARNSELKISPNPAVGGRFTIDIPSSVNSEVPMIVTNSLGQKVYETKAQTNVSNSISLDLPAGVYTVHAIVQNTQYHHRIVVAN